jgi:hypothetical protein
MRDYLPVIYRLGQSRVPVSAGRNEFVGRSQKTVILASPAVIFRAIV